MKQGPLTFDFAVVRGENKNMFFDREAVMSMLEAKERKSLEKIGRFMRVRVRSGLRRRKRISEPGESPSIRSRHAFETLRNVLYYYEPSQSSVIIGPRLLNGNKPKNSDAASVPQLLEQGGRQDIPEWYSERWQRWLRGSGPKRSQVPRRTRRSQYEPRPFLRPALEAEIAAGTLVGFYARA